MSHPAANAGRPLFSVIVPAFNAAAYIEATLDSIRHQTFSGYEVVVANDGSQDDTLEVLLSFQRRHPEFPLVIISELNSGAGAARNAALKVARGEFAAFLDADDHWHAGKLMEMSRALALRPDVDVLYHDEDEIWPNGKRRSLRRFQLMAPVFENLLFGDRRGNPVSPSAAVVRRGVIEAAGWWTERRDLDGSEDIDLWLRLARVGATFLHLPIVLGEYRRVENSLTMKVDYHADRGWKVFEMHFRECEQSLTPQDRSRRFGEKRSGNFISRSKAHELQGNRSGAWRAARSAVSAAPAWWRSYVPALWLLYRTATNRTPSVSRNWRAFGAAPAVVVRKMNFAAARQLRSLTFHDVRPQDRVNFREQLLAIRRHYRFVDLTEFLGGLREPDRHRDPCVLLTFDDGYQCTTAAALEVLSELSIKGVFFVPNEFIECATEASAKQHVADRFFLGRRTPADVPDYLRPSSWKQIRQLADAGHEIGAHTYGHRPLRDVANLQHEIVDAGNALEVLVGRPVRTFAYPFGRAETVTPAAIACVASRYECAFTSIRGNNVGQDPHLLRRHAISASAAPGFVLLELAGGLSFRHRQQRQLLSQLQAASSTLWAT